ncbi:MHYT domain-containing protein [Peribacillus acanthi]|uniref:MHYT domain-containing protein n=1 Tax=Peribacillus acanthi TaxID=2171554 RepID=UPI000D3E2D0C|nr:MHYT domain-containing protein [Peribacillus acanthi]
MSFSGDYDYKLVILSILVAILSSFASFNSIARIGDSPHKKKMVWIISGSFIMGLGIWSMHFIGMLGYNVHVMVSYHAGYTLLSLLMAFIASCLSFSIILYFERKIPILFLGSVVMGMSILSMHFLGMKSMNMPYEIEYDGVLALLSIIVSIGASGLAIYLLLHNERNTYHLVRTTVSSVIMGLGISAVHYSAMKSMILYKNQGNHGIGDGMKGLSNYISTELLAFGLSLTTVFFVLIIILFAHYDKIQAEKLQRFTESHYRSMVDQNPYLVFTVDMEGIITHVNSKGMELLKGEKNHIISRPLLSFFHERDRDRVSITNIDLKYEERKAMEATLYDLEGSSIPMFLTFIPIVIEERVTGAFVVGRDNSDVQEYRQRIHKAQRDLVNTIRKQQGLTLKYIKVGDRFIHTLCDGELLYKLGLTPSMVVGKSLEDILPEGYPTYLKIEAYRKAWEGKVTEYEADLNGVYYYVILSPVFKNGKVVEVIGSGVDITDRKKAEETQKRNEEWYKNILSSMSEGIMLFNDTYHATHLYGNIYEALDVKTNELHTQDLEKNGFEFIRDDGQPLTLKGVASGKCGFTTLRNSI